MSKTMRTITTVLGVVVALSALALAIRWGVVGEREDLTVLCRTEQPVYTVGVSAAGWSKMGQNANGDPLAWGDSLTFQVDSWPVEVTLYGDPAGKRPLATCVVTGAAGEEWLLTAQDGPEGLELSQSRQGQ